MSLEQSAEIDHHLEGCPACGEALEKVKAFFAYMDDPGSDPVPQAATAHILNIYQRRPAVQELENTRVPGKAFLVFDDWSMAVNERFSGIDTRQLLFEIDDFTLDLRLELQGDNCRVSGQLFPECAEAAISFSSDESSISTVLSDLGEFSLSPLPQASYDITLSIGQERLSIPKVPLKR
ncbi:MAG: hypothetical protein QM785_11165 [Pyrinomonadaceae bacterium]